MDKQRFLSSSFKYKEQDPSFYGQQLDERYSRGPVQQRKCTDVFCCIIFLAMIGGMIYIGILGYKTGNPSLLAAPFDQDGNQCGVTQGYKKYQKIYISYMLNDPTDVGFVCVKDCPSSINSTLQCKTNKIVTNCELLKLYQSQTIVNLCYPPIQIIQQFNFNKYMDVTNLQKYFADLKTGWPLLLICIGFAFIISIIFTIFIRFCSACFVWSTIILFQIFMICLGLCTFMIDRWQWLQNIINYNNLPTNLKDRDYQIVCAIICWVLAFIQLLLICCFYKQIRICNLYIIFIAIGILKAAADFTRQQCYTFLIPIIITFLQILYLAIWLTTILYIFSSSQSTIQPIQNTPFGFVIFNTNIQWFTVLYIFGLIWIVLFIQAIGMYWTCSAVAIWYFEEGQPNSPICRSILRSLKQLGSLAFGSLIIAIIVSIRIAMEYFTKILKQKTLGMQQQVGPVKFALKCASCCIACFERIIRFLTNNAYIMMAISGKNFCESASQSFYLVLKSTMQFTITHGTTKIFILFGKLMIVSICCVVGYFTLILIEYYKNKIYSPVFLTVLFAIVSYPIASAFLTLFQMASNTILMCYCLELDLVKGDNPKCPAGLRNFLRNYVNQSVQSQEAIK